MNEEEDSMDVVGRSNECCVCNEGIIDDIFEFVYLNSGIYN